MEASPFTGKKGPSVFIISHVLEFILLFCVVVLRILYCLPTFYRVPTSCDFELRKSCLSHLTMRLTEATYTSRSHMNTSVTVSFHLRRNPADDHPKARPHARSLTPSLPLPLVTLSH